MLDTIVKAAPKNSWYKVCPRNRTGQCLPAGKFEKKEISRADKLKTGRFSLNGKVAADAAFEATKAAAEISHSIAGGVGTQSQSLFNKLKKLKESGHITPAQHTSTSEKHERLAEKCEALTVKAPQIVYKRAADAHIKAAYLHAKAAKKQEKAMEKEGKGR